MGYELPYSIKHQYVVPKNSQRKLKIPLSGHPTEVTPPSFSGDLGFKLPSPLELQQLNLFSV